MNRSVGSATLFRAPAANFDIRVEVWVEARSNTGTNADKLLRAAPFYPGACPLFRTILYKRRRDPE